MLEVSFDREITVIINTFNLPLKNSCYYIVKKSNAQYDNMWPTRKHQSFPSGTSGKEPACQCKRHKRYKFNP